MCQFSEKLRAENEALAHKMRQEAENRAKRDAEIKAELDQSRNNNKSEILELFDRVKRDLEQRKVDTGNYFLASKICYTTTSPFSEFEFCKIIKEHAAVSDRHCQVKRSNKFHRSSLPKGTFQLKRGHRVIIIRFFVSY